MTTITAKVILDSVGRDAPRLSSVPMRYPRFIHAELMTHRAFSRNARSSRAVPVSKMIDEVRFDPAVPLHWGKAQSGMQAYEELGGQALIDAKSSWHRAREAAIQEAQVMVSLGLAKQNVNRILEPYIHIDVLVTAAEWSNFLALRDHPAAEPHIQMLAREVKAALAASTPQRLLPGQWHLPYVDEEAGQAVFRRFASFIGKDKDFRPHEADLLQEMLNLASAGRCARISYKPFDSNGADIGADLTLAEQLSKSGHWSPFEHQATPDARTPRYNGDHTPAWDHPNQHGNLVGWRQFRKMFPGESGVAASAA